MPRAIVFDDGKGRLAPLTDLRPAFDVRTGALTTLERLTLAMELDVVALAVPPTIETLSREAHGSIVNTEVGGSEPVLLLNGRGPLPLDAALQLGAGEALVEAESGDLVAARVEPGWVAGVLAGGTDGLSIQTLHERVLMARPWHWRSVRDAAVAIDLETMIDRPSADIPTGVVAYGNEPVIIDPAARIYPGAVLDTEKGPVVIESGATVRPGATIIGPAFVGRGSHVLDHALVKAHTAIGPVCKVAGEVGACVFQGYANKGHDGHLGDSWIGHWVNLGAGTTNSNLLNTYGEITAVAATGEPRERTGEMYLGATIGDHVKAAICSRLMTGVVVHTGAMWAASSPMSGCVDAMTWTTDAGSKPYRFDRFFSTERTMMARRDITPSEAYEARLREISDAPSNPSTRHA